jgi:signal transduction histidine kinase
MPDMTGLEMIEEIKAPLPAERDIAMIVVTGHADTRRAVKALQLGAMDFLAKPIDPDIFIHATDRAVESICLKRLEREFRKQLECRVFERTEEVQKLSSELLTANDVLMVKNAELEASNQIKSEFLTLISHELRTPLNAIIGFSSLIEMNNGQNENDGMVEYNRGILDSGNNLLRIINTILELIDVSSGDQKLNKTDLDINYLITRVVEVLKPKADEAGVEIILNLTIAPDFIYADSHSLTQVIGNILDNAIQFSANSGPVVITSLSNNDEVTITIADEGIGMTKDQMKIAEEPFRQVDSSLSKTAYGMGLGLPMSRLFVEMHGGRMNIHSSDGEGTIVDISLPKKSDHNE